MKTLIASLFLSLLLISPARATPVTWMLEDVVLEDGGTVTGGFAYDPDMGINGFSDIHLMASGYNLAAASKFPILSSQTFSKINYADDDMTEIAAYYGMPKTVESCYNDGGLTAPCEFFSSLSMQFQYSLMNAKRSTEIVNGNFTMYCALIDCPNPGSDYSVEERIVSGYLCTEIPCPGGPPIQVPEPSSLIMIGIGLLGLAAASKQWAIV